MVDVGASAMQTPTIWVKTILLHDGASINLELSLINDVLCTTTAKTTHTYKYINCM